MKNIETFLRLASICVVLMIGFFVISAIASRTACPMTAKAAMFISYGAALMGVGCVLGLCWTLFYAMFSELAESLETAITTRTEQLWLGIPLGLATYVTTVVVILQYLEADKLLSWSNAWVVPVTIVTSALGSSLMDSPQRMRAIRQRILDEADRATMISPGIPRRVAMINGIPTVVIDLKALLEMSAEDSRERRKRMERAIILN